MLLKYFLSVLALLVVGFNDIAASVKQNYIVLNKDVTTCIVMPENIKTVDISTANIVGNQFTDSMIRLKPSTEVDSLSGKEVCNYVNGQLLGTITLVGERHMIQLDVLYNGRPEAATQSKFVSYDDLRAYSNPKVGMSEQDMAKFAWAVYSSGRKFHCLTSKANGLKATVNNIYAVDNYFFIDFTIENKSKIKYDINELRVFLTDKKEVKATNAQTLEIRPVYTLNANPSFKKNYRNVIVLEKLTFPEEKILRIELSENQISGRVIDISIEYNDILNADGFSPDVLRSIAKAPVVPHMNRDYYEQPKSK